MRILNKQWQELRGMFRRVTRYGTARECPCCHAMLRVFAPYGLVRREEALCPVCRSLERHRLIWLYLTRNTDLFDGRPKKLLHVAPEVQLSRLFQAHPEIDYLSADLCSPKAMVKMDITDIQYPADTFDVVYCSHVLEHVPDDRKAMREFYRVLKPGGWAILLVPITVKKTFEDPSVTSPEERERIFGQHDHVRRYGPDYVDRLREAGFDVKADDFASHLDENEARRYGIRRGDLVYLCRK